jgi:hypothetical protein
MATPMVPFSPGVQSAAAAEPAPDAAGAAASSLPLLQAARLKMSPAAANADTYFLIERSFLVGHGTGLVPWVVRLAAG